MEEPVILTVALVMLVEVLAILAAAAVKPVVGQVKLVGEPVILTVGPAKMMVEPMTCCCSGQEIITVVSS